MGMVKTQGIKCSSQKCSRKLHVSLWRNNPISVLGVIEADLCGAGSGKTCSGEFSVIGVLVRTLLEKETTE